MQMAAASGMERDCGRTSLRDGGTLRDLDDIYRRRKHGAGRLPDGGMYRCISEPERFRYR